MTMNLTERAADKAAERELLHDILREMRADRAQSTDVVTQLMSQLRNGVLETGSILINSDGWAERDFRVSYAAVMLSNPTAALVTVTSNPPAGSAPTGPGSFQIPAGTYATVNLAGNSFTIYGTAGTRVSYQVFTAPQVPSAGLVGQAAAGGQLVSGSSASNTDGVQGVGTGLVPVQSILYALNNAGLGFDRLRNGAPGRLQINTGAGATTLINAQGGVAPGATVDMTVGYANYAMTTVVTGGPATVSVNLEGSHDNVTWYVLGTSTSTTGDLTSVIGKPCRYLRANVITLSSGTVTARVTPA